MDIFTGVTFDWGFTAADIMTNVMTLFGGLAMFILLGLAIFFAPKIIDLVKKSAS